MAIDDGVASRGHRGNIFKPDFQKIGVCLGRHVKYNEMTDVIYEGKLGSNEAYFNKVAADKVTQKAIVDSGTTTKVPTTNLIKDQSCAKSILTGIRPTCALNYCCG